MKAMPPCRATVFAEKNGKRYRKVFGTGYSAETILARWASLGYSRITVYLDSASTGRNVRKIANW
jgi:hypothetical protein